MKKFMKIISSLLLAAVVITGCQTAPKEEVKNPEQSATTTPNDRTKNVVSKSYSLL